MIKSKVLYTEEIDDMQLASEELFRQAEGFELEKSSFGLIFMDVETDYDELYGVLKEKWDIPFVGVTAIGMLTGCDGYCKSGISVMLLTSSDCRFAVGMTQGLTADDYRKPVRKTIETLEKELEGDKVRLVLTYGGKTAHGSGDDVVTAVDELGKGYKMYGAYSSDVFTFKDYRIMCNEKTAFGEQVFVLISGNVDPRFVSVQSLSGKVNFSYEVTSSKANKVFKLGNGTFLEALERSGLGLDTAKDLVVAEFIQTPFITVFENPDGTRFESLRVLTKLDHEDGSGLFLGGIAEGSSLELGLLNREDVKTTVKNAFDEIFEWLKADGKDHSTILCSSCAARFLVMGNDGSMEAESYKDRLPENISLMGMYSYGEFCPVGENGYNLFHNSTFTIMCL